MLRAVVVSAMISTASALAAQSTTFATPNGSHLALGRFCYTIQENRDGTPKPVGLTYQSISRETFRGVDALAIVVHQHLANGTFDMRDSFIVRRDTLQPIQLDSERNGSPHVHLEYKEKEVTGWKMVGADKKEIHVDLTGPVWDGNLWGETFAALPLRPDAAFRVPVYQYDSGLGAFYIHVLGQRPADPSHGNIVAWQIKAGLSQTEQVDYTVSTQPGLEIGYSAGPSSQQLGGDCTALR